MVEISGFADRIGRRRIAEALGIGPTAVSNAVVRGAFPASWFLVLRGLAQDEDIECPSSLFNMRAGDDLSSAAREPREGSDAG
ncbi:hypothetical protein C2I36_09555 [Rhodobacteraceae bacterium WD3A24]|nr:hypothetical protein C2I36_09555 [Rhodobacteraceae bacterium WD3A24]